MLLLRPTVEDIKVIGFNIGKLIFGLGFVMIIPAFISVLFGEWDVCLDFFIALLSCLVFGLLLQIICKTDRDLTWMQGLVVASTSWLIAMFLGAIPLYLSGHCASFLDALFDAMSGFATTGLSLIQDKDHLSFGVNMWRHLMMFLGGQGIVVVGLTFLIKGTGGAYRMYVGEAREERILPNVVQTARFIWFISLVYLVVGTVALAIVGIVEGMPVIKSFFHGMWLFMAAFDTGGFTPQSQSILYYHSFPIEFLTMILMIMGTLNFAIHYALWTGNRKEPLRNIEVITLVTSIAILFTITALALKTAGAYPGIISMIRKGFYQVLSAHSGTGYMTVYAQQFVGSWRPLAMLGVAIAMGIGGSACSTAGGIKVLRLGIFFKALIQDIKRILSPGSAIIVERFHHLKDLVLEERFVRSAMLIMLFYILTYLFGTIAGMFYGYPLSQASFESISAAANVGLSCGITNPSMPALLKIVYIIQMWVGRLEFMSVFALIGFIIAGIRGK